MQVCKYASMQVCKYAHIPKSAFVIARQKQFTNPQALARYLTALITAAALITGVVIAGGWGKGNTSVCSLYHQ